MVKIPRSGQSSQNEPPELPEPPNRREPDPQERNREQALKAWRRQEAERRKVPLQVVLPARSLEFLKREPDSDLHQCHNSVQSA